MKKQAIIVGLLVVILFSFSMTISGLALLNENKLAKSSSTNQNLLDFATAAAPSVKMAPTPAPSPAPTTPIETIFLAGGGLCYNGTGAPSVNNVLSSNDGVSYGQLTATASWPRRSYHTLTAFTGLLYVMGGETLNSSGLYGDYNDVHISGDGTNWIQLLANAPWGSRTNHNTISFNGQLFLMGGRTLITTGSTVSWSYFNDVWSSLNGINWTFLGNAPWAGRDQFASVVFNNQIFVIGGDGQPQSFGDVWSSPDGINWIQRTTNVPWGSWRYGHSAVVFNGKIYLMGGVTISNSVILSNDVWSSSDGVNWIQETAAAPWAARMGHVSFVFDGYMWVIGGFDHTFARKIYADAWKSRDGINWTRVTTANIPNLGGCGFAGVVMP